MSPRVLFINGPPRSGKDEAGKIAAGLLRGWQGVGSPHVEIVKFAKILKERTHALYGVTCGDSGDPVDQAHFEDVKDKPQDAFLGLTPRQAYINVSERLMKPVHGQAVWGKLLLDEMKNKFADCFIITDAGFYPEAVPILDHFGSENCRLIRMHRSGCDFMGDSRGYIVLPRVSDFDINNDCDKSALRQTVEHYLLISEWLK